MMKILVTASRDWFWRLPIAEALRDSWLEYGDPWEAYSYETELVHGAARGGDQISASLARSWGWTDCPFPVTAEQWRRSRGAGLARSTDMVRYVANYQGPKVCLAFIKNNSRGATHCMRLAKNAGIPTRVYRLPVIVPRRRSADESSTRKMHGVLPRV